MARLKKRFPFAGNAPYVCRRIKTTMTLLPFGNLPPHRARTFLPAKARMTQWAAIEPHFDRLESEAAACTTPKDFERWLHHSSELASALDEEGSGRYIAMTCHTDHPDAKKAYLHFVETIEPKLKERQFRLAKVFLAHQQRAKLPGRRYEVLNRDTELLVELFRPQNIPLETQETKLGQQYQELIGALTVRFRGEEKTLVQMGVYQQETDRSLRHTTWEAVCRRRLKEATRIDSLFDKLLSRRVRMARNAGYSNYRDYMHRAKGRFDYRPEDCFEFHRAVETEVMPLVRQLHAARRSQMGLKALRPWDLAVDPLGRPPLKPFVETDEMVRRTQRIFDRMDGELASGFRGMKRLKLLDLANRKGKAPGGYQSCLAESRLPFIFMNAVGMQRDVETLLHEAGHAFHSLAAQEEDLHSYRSAPLEFCEVASMSMELLGNAHLDEFYTPPDAARACQTHLENIILLLPWVAMVDAFQHWLYTHPEHTRAERDGAWLKLMERFGGEVDWSGYHDAKRKSWHRQLHIFLCPFYYIEYGIAQLGALQVWANSQRDLPKALRQYKDALSLGGSRPLPELFAKAGCRFRFDARTVKPLMAMVKRQLARMANGTPVR